VGSDPRSRDRLEDYSRRHESDRFAHGAMREFWGNGLSEAAQRIEDRLTALERWQQRVIGALSLLSLLIVGGIITVVVELARR
jgi:hypothetical protein